jgi:hypothetical protein
MDGWGTLGESVKHEVDWEDVRKEVHQVDWKEVRAKARESSKEIDLEEACRKARKGLGELN